MTRACPVLASLCCLAAGSAAACDLALLFAVDVSGSVDRREYVTQMRGLADGLRDPVVAEALVRGQASLALMQWTGSSRQDLTLGWQTVRTEADLELMAEKIGSAPRIWTEYSTAIGEALTFAVQIFGNAPACKRRVLDISGDGRSNEGRLPAEIRPELEALGITVNALVIRGFDRGLPDYFADNVIAGGNAFVVTAENYNEYPDRMRRKLRRETERQISMSEDDKSDSPAAEGPRESSIPPNL